MSVGFVTRRQIDRSVYVCPRTITVARSIEGAKKRSCVVVLTGLGCQFALPYGGDRSKFSRRETLANERYRVSANDDRHAQCLFGTSEDPSLIRQSG